MQSTSAGCKPRPAGAAPRPPSAQWIPSLKSGQVYQTCHTFLEAPAPLPIGSPVDPACSGCLLRRAAARRGSERHAAATATPGLTHRSSARSSSISRQAMVIRQASALACAGLSPASSPLTPRPPLCSVESRWHTLPDGTRLEVLCAEAAAPPSASGAAPAPSRPPLLLLHGAWHGAWCWAEHFLPFFAAAGYDSYALSLRGHGGSELEEQHPAARQTGTLQSHLDDIASFVATLSRPPVLLGHSLGGLFAVAYAGQAAGGGRPPLAGLALLGAVPPSGTGSIIRRLLWRQPLQVLRIGW